MKRFFLVLGLVSGCSKPAPVAAVADAAAVSTTTGGNTAPEAEKKKDGGPYNVLFISVDSLRADMPWAGYARPIAPRLSALEAKAITYRRGYSASSFTAKSVATMLSGRFPSEMERTGSFFTKYLASNRFMCEGLEEEGIPCFAGHAHAYLGPKLGGFDQGFRDWRLVPGITFDYNKDPYVTSDKLTKLAIEMLGKAGEGDAKKPFFAWFHYMDPHDEYKTHSESPHFGTKVRDLYDEEVFFTDMWIGKLLDYVETQPWAKKTVIVVSADHGEAFGEHGLMRHAHELWEELVHVPLFFVVPGAARRVIDVPRSHVDLVPTFLELLGAKADPTLAGVSLVSELRGGETPARDVVFDLPEDEHNDRRKGLIHDKYKLVAFGNDAYFTLFDLESDPREKDDLIKKKPDVLADMRARYKVISKKDIAPKGGIKGKTAP
jgi:choline-sulfatase